MLGSVSGWWAEDEWEGEAWEVGRGGSAGAMGGIVSVSFARTSVSLHVPADDAGIGCRGRWAGEELPFGLMQGPLKGLEVRVAVARGAEEREAVGEAAERRVVC